MYLNFRIKIPEIIANLVLWFVLRHRKKHHGRAFRRIKLIAGKHVDAKHRYAIVDPDDYQKLALFDWYFFETANKNYYAFRLDNRKIIYMHRQIMNAPKGKIVDHKDGNALNNTKQNLRFATHSQNTCNSRRAKKGSSKYRGVSWNKCHKKWRADIYYNGIYKHLGYFDNEQDAARAYDQAAKIYHGEFAVLNFEKEQVSSRADEQLNKRSIENRLSVTVARLVPLEIATILRFLTGLVSSIVKTFYVKHNRFELRNRWTIYDFLKYHLLDGIILLFIISFLYVFAGMLAETNMIRINELRKRFGPIVAVDGVSFEVEKGQVLGFLGPNGAGKSTVMRMLACFLRPDSGTAQVCGFDILKNPIQVRQNIGYLAENVPAYNEMTVGAFLNFICDTRNLEDQKRKQALDKAVSMCHIESVYHQTIETLSKGYKRRVGLAQALIHDPPVLILDEPTDGLDPNQKYEVRLLIGKMAKDKCIVVSTHILEEVEAVCDRAIIIARGKILADSTPRGLKDKYNCTLDEVFRKITAHKVA